MIFPATNVESPSQADPPKLGMNGNQAGVHGGADTWPVSGSRSVSVFFVKSLMWKEF